MQLLNIRNDWLCMLPLLLLAAALAGSLLDANAFDVDESATLLRIGVRPTRVFTPEEVVQAIYEKSPDQALGWPLLVSGWVRVAGWSEVALRSLSWFGGLLAIAWIWRAGRHMFGAPAGLVAAALLSTSVFFVTYMAIARAFSLVVLFTVLSVYGYWRTMLRPGPAGGPDRAMLLTGAVGLLYAHYFGALLLPALCLFHLLCVRRDRRWLQTLLMFLLAGLAFLPALGSLLRGVDFNLARPGLSQGAMAPHVAVARIIEIYSNGLVGLLPKIAALLFVLAAGMAVHAAWQRGRARIRPNATWLLVFVTLASLALILVANEFAGVLLSGRVRYTFALWPLFSLLLGLACLYFRPLDSPRFPLFQLLLALLLVTGLVGNIRSSLRVRYVYHLPVPPLHLAMRDLEMHWTGGDRLVVDKEIRPNLRSYRAYTDYLGDGRVILPSGKAEDCDAACLDTLLPEPSQHRSVWLMFANPDGALQGRMRQALQSSGLVPCRRTDYRHDPALSLMRLVHKSEDCG